MERVFAMFVDGNAVWNERGTLRRAKLGPHGGPHTDGFVLELDDGGNRVFPIQGRQVEVYLAGQDDPCVVTCNGDVLTDTWEKR